MALFRLAYLSRSLIDGSPEQHREQLGHILLSARRNNEKRAVTGALLATEHYFAQVLEGERAEVEEMYEVIGEDPRHQRLVLLLAETIDERQFPQWSMAYIDPNQTVEQAVERLAGGVSESEGAEKMRKLLTMMGDMVAPGPAGTA